MNDELDGRRRRAIAAMVSAGVDALLVIGGTNLCYLAGHPVPERTMARPMYLLLPRSGEPVLITHAFRFDQVRRYASVDDVRRYEELGRAPVGLIADALRDRGLLSATIGVELGYETQLNAPVADLDLIRNTIDSVAWVDAAQLLWRLRFRKSAWELDRMRRAGAIAQHAIDLAFACARRGTSETELSLLLRTTMIRGAGGDAYAVVVTGEGNYDLPNSFEGRPIEPGDMVFVDAGCSSGGYWMEHSRSAVVGAASGDQLEVHRHVYEATLAGISMVRPGAPIGAVAAACRGVLDRLAIPITSNISTNSARFGHSFGAEAIEPPHIAETDPTVLEPGMVLAVEPGVATQFGRFHIRHNVVVTEDGYDLLPGPDWALRIIT